MKLFLFEEWTSKEFQKGIAHNKSIYAKYHLSDERKTFEKPADIRNDIKTRVDFSLMFH